jgi:glycosyltransferase involved in cell wall biosynthesis
MEIPSVKFPHQVTVVSRVQQKYLKERYGIDSVYIPTGVNSPKIEPPELIRRYGLKGRDYILFAARLVREKGVHYLIEAYNRLKPPLKLIITGDVHHERGYKSELKSLAGDNKNIIFTGFVTGKLLDELFSNCYIFVLPSEVEGLSTALLEAMSYGNCCLVSDIPENLEALNGFGRTFISKDVSSLAEHIDYLISNPQFVDSIRPEAQRHVLKNYSWDTIADKFEKLYNELLV